MRIKKYVAKTMREALMDIKKDLGESAVILKTRKMKSTAFPFGAQDIEVTAAIEEEQKGPTPAFPELKMADAARATGVYSKPRTSCIIENAGTVEMRPWRPPLLSETGKKTVSSPAVEKKDDCADARYAELRDDLKKLSNMVTSVLGKGTVEAAPSEAGFSGGWSVLYKKLVDSEVRPDMAEGLIKSLQSGIAGAGSVTQEDKMLALLQARFPISGPVRCNKGGPAVIVFVGPTGSGKTTTLAKLAAHACLQRKKKVSVITADTYRIAAIEQIRVFADIIKADLHVVFSPDEIPAAIKACSSSDLVFVDTAGRSPHSVEHMEELKKYVDGLQPSEVHLVLSATTKDSDLRDSVERFRAVGANRLLFTKLDETRTVGNIYNTVNASGMPVSFLTSGQSVPDDIELAQPARFAQRLWEGTAA